MKRIFAVALAIIALAVPAFASGAQESDPNVIKVGATPDPHAAILNEIVDQLAAEGYDLQVVEFTDYVTPNEALASGELDANYFQHLPYMESANAERGYDLVSAGGIADAVVRTAYKKAYGRDLGRIEFTQLKNIPAKVATVDFNGTSVKVAVAEGTANMIKLVEAIESGVPEVKDVVYVEALACVMLDNIPAEIQQFMKAII